MMKDLETELQNEGFGNEPFELKFKGLKTSDYINPTQATALFCDIDRNNLEGIDKLKKLVHRIVQESLQRGLVSKTDLAKSHIQYQNGQYINKKLNVALI